MGIGLLLVVVILTNSRSARGRQEDNRTWRCTCRRNQWHSALLCGGHPSPTSPLVGMHRRWWIATFGHHYLPVQAKKKVGGAHYNSDLHTCISGLASARSTVHPPNWPHDSAAFLRIGVRSTSGVGEVCTESVCNARPGSRVALMDWCAFRPPPVFLLPFPAIPPIICRGGPSLALFTRPHPSHTCTSGAYRYLALRVLYLLSAVPSQRPHAHALAHPRPNSSPSLFLFSLRCGTSLLPAACNLFASCPD